MQVLGFANPAHDHRQDARRRGLQDHQGGLREPRPVGGHLQGRGRVQAQNGPDVPLPLHPGPRSTINKRVISNSDRFLTGREPPAAPPGAPPYRESRGMQLTAKNYVIATVAIAWSVIQLYNSITFDLDILQLEFCICPSP